MTQGKGGPSTCHGPSCCPILPCLQAPQSHPPAMPCWKRVNMGDVLPLHKGLLRPALSGFQCQVVPFIFWSSHCLTSFLFLYSSISASQFVCFRVWATPEYLPHLGWSPRLTECLIPPQQTLGLFHLQLQPSSWEAG